MEKKVALQRIRDIARDIAAPLEYTDHARERMIERCVGTPDLVRALRNCWIFEGPTSEKDPETVRVAVDGRTGDGDLLRIVIELREKGEKPPIIVTVFPV